MGDYGREQTDHRYVAYFIWPHFKKPKLSETSNSIAMIAIVNWISLAVISLTSTAEINFKLTMEEGVGIIADRELVREPSWRSHWTKKDWVDSGNWRLAYRSSQLRCVKHLSTQLKKRHKKDLTGSTQGLGRYIGLVFLGEDAIIHTQWCSMN